MGLDWSTFLLEIVNFLILVWILKRLLYAPVKAAIERRRHRIEAVLAEADARRAEAERLRSEYESRQQGWERERAVARAELDQALNRERERRLAVVDAEITQRREQAEILDRRVREETVRHAEEKAFELAADFSARLLSRVSGQTLEARLVDMFIEDLATLDDERRQALAALTRDSEADATISSAYPLDAARRAAVEQALFQAAGGDLACTFDEDPALIAGLRVDAGALVMCANLRDELRFFAEAAR